MHWMLTVVLTLVTTSMEGPEVRAEEPVTCYSQDGSTIKGRLVSIKGDRVMLTSVDWISGDSGTKSDTQRILPLDPLVEMAFADGAAKELDAPEAGVELADGTYLGGDIVGGGDEAIVLRSPGLGRLTIPLFVITRIVLAKPSLPRDFEPYPFGTSDDVLYKVDGVRRGTNFLEGTLEHIDEKGVLFDSSLGTLEFVFAQVEAVVLAAPEPLAPIDGRGVRVLLKDGTGAIPGVLISAGSGKVRIRTAAGLSLDVPFECIATLLFDSENWVHLSDLKPLRVTQTPYIGDAVHFLYPWKRDRSVTGRPLRIRNRLFARGIGLHARTILVYALEKRYKAFLAWGGIAHEVETLKAAGSVTLRIEGGRTEALREPGPSWGPGPATPAHGGCRRRGDAHAHRGLCRCLRLGRSCGDRPSSTHPLSCRRGASALHETSWIGERPFNELERAIRCTARRRARHAATTVGSVPLKGYGRRFHEGEERCKGDGDEWVGAARPRPGRGPAHRRRTPGSRARWNAI